MYVCIDLLALPVRNHEAIPLWFLFGFEAHLLVFFLVVFKEYIIYVSYFLRKLFGH